MAWQYMDRQRTDLLPPIFAAPHDRAFDHANPGCGTRI
jgi:hypothetical protein